MLPHATDGQTIPNYADGRSTDTRRADSAYDADKARRVRICLLAAQALDELDTLDPTARPLYGDPGDRAEFTADDVTDLLWQQISDHDAHAVARELASLQRGYWWYLDKHWLLSAPAWEHMTRTSAALGFRGFANGLRGRGWAA